MERHDVRTTMVERSGCPSRAGVITQITRDLSPGTHDISFTIVILPNQGEMTSYFGRSHCNESVITQGTERSMTSPVNRRVTHLLRNTGLLSNGDINIIYFMPFLVRKLFVDLCRLGQVFVYQGPTPELNVF